MKQLIVLVASVILGIGIGGIVLGFRGTATELGNSAKTGLTGIATVMSQAAIDAKNTATNGL